MDADLPRTVAAESLKATPATGVLVAKANGITFSADDLATYLAIAFLSMQIAWFIWEKAHPRWKKRRGKS